MIKRKILATSFIFSFVLFYFFIDFDEGPLPEEWVRSEEFLLPFTKDAKYLGGVRDSDTEVWKFSIKTNFKNSSEYYNSINTTLDEKWQYDKSCKDSCVFKVNGHIPLVTIDFNEGIAHLEYRIYGEK